MKGCVCVKVCVGLTHLRIFVGLLGLIRSQSLKLFIKPVQKYYLSFSALSFSKINLLFSFFTQINSQTLRENTVFLSRFFITCQTMFYFIYVVSMSLTHLKPIEINNKLCDSINLLFNLSRYPQLVRNLNLINFNFIFKDFPNPNYNSSLDLKVKLCELQQSDNFSAFCDMSLSSLLIQQVSTNVMPLIYGT